MQKIIDFSDVKIQCSQIGVIMVQPRNGGLSEKQLVKLEKLQTKFAPLTPIQEIDLAKLLLKRDNEGGFGVTAKCRPILMEIYEKKRYGTGYKMIGDGRGVSQMIKGVKTERSITDFLSKIDGVPYYKDKRRLSNEYITGSFDIMDGPTVEQSSKIIDVKSSFDVRTHLNRYNKKLDKIAYWEMQGYLALTGKEVGQVHYCLVDFPEDTIAEQKLLIMEQMTEDGKSDVEILRAVEKAEASMRFSYISVEERIISHRVDRDDEAIEQIYERVVYCRKWLQEWQSIHEKLIQQRFFTEDSFEDNGYDPCEGDPE